jgi:hypothetical protein
LVAIPEDVSNTMSHWFRSCSTISFADVGKSWSDITASAVVLSRIECLSAAAASGLRWAA